jgi:hypothetical protein
MNAKSRPLSHEENAFTGGLRVVIALKANNSTHHMIDDIAIKFCAQEE